jgi:pepF/M3 family oligoendopeptidase
MPNGSRTQTTGLPRWDLSPIYPSFDAPEYRADRKRLAERIAAFLALLEAPFPASGVREGAPALLALIRSYEEAVAVEENLSAYAQAVYTTDTRNGRALAEINALDEAGLPLAKGAVLFRNLLAEHRDFVCSALEADKGLEPYAFFIRESLEKAAYQMAPELEDLANDLSRSGGNAWSRLQEAVASTVQAVWDPAAGERKTVSALRDLAFNPDREIRERAYRAELEAWRSMEIPLAASLNGVKGTALTVDKRRGWKSPLAKAAFQSRLSEKALNTLIAALESALPLFCRYLKAKARCLGLKTCAFYDLFAPLGASVKRWTWEETGTFIEDQFARFDPDMGGFARRAIDRRWIDAEGREGKVGGAYCTDFPLAGESRILCNFEGSFDSVTTVAHELGHGWHHEVIKDLGVLQSRYPMTLAETASIFAETLVFEGALSGAPADERLGLIEVNLKDCCQVIVDILSRFYFERALFERREQAELSPEELCALMIDAQKKTYGDGLDQELLHPYMWAVKSHYYSTGLGFYNYPYAFGQLFSLGLYARAKEEGPDFAGTYRELLRRTGRGSAKEVTEAAGFNIEEDGFWQKGLGVIAARAAEFEKLVESRRVM